MELTNEVRDEAILLRRKNKMKLPDAMKQEVDKFSQNSNVEATFNISGTEQELRPEIETAILRILVSVS